MPAEVAKIAVSAATYWIDKPYDYLIPEPLLERIAVYFAFRYLLKAVNDGDLLGRAQLCLLAVLAVERLAAVTGLPEALRRFSCEIEHDEDNLDALLDAFYQGDVVSLPQLLAALES